MGNSPESCDALRRASDRNYCRATRGRRSRCRKTGSAPGAWAGAWEPIRWDEEKIGDAHDRTPPALTPAFWVSPATLSVSHHTAGCDGRHT